LVRPNRPPLPLCLTLLCSDHASFLVLQPPSCSVSYLWIVYFVLSHAHLLEGSSGVAMENALNLFAVSVRSQVAVPVVNAYRVSKNHVTTCQPLSQHVNPCHSLATTPLPTPLFSPQPDVLVLVALGCGCPDWCQVNSQCTMYAVCQHLAGTVLNRRQTQ
jgi:hypothetical protein